MWYAVYCVLMCTSQPCCACACCKDPMIMLFKWSQVRELLETATHEKPIAVALDVLSIYLRCYGSCIREGCEQDVLHDVDVQAWRDRCLTCRIALQGVAPQLAAVEQAHQGTHLGRKAQELQQEAACLS